MKKLINLTLTTVFALMIASSAWSSNIRITSEPKLIDGGGTGADGSLIVSFGLAWDYSWKSPQLRNHDAAWVFAKYRVAQRDWDHMYLDPGFNPTTGGGFSDKSFTNEGGTEAPSPAPVAWRYAGTTDGVNGQAVGVFLYRRDNGVGHIYWDNIAIRWNFAQHGIYASDGPSGVLTASDIPDIVVRVFAIEMVYVPRGPFFLGDGAVGDGNFTSAATLNTVMEPFRVMGEGAISIANRPTVASGIDANMGMLSVTSNNFAATGSGIGPVGAGAIPADYPKGFNAFYIMKYEITQGAYMEFLNTIQFEQQIPRIRVLGGVGNHINHGVRVMRSPEDLANDRNWIVVLDPSAQRVFGMNAGADIAVLNEDDDGKSVAMAFSKQDFLAYLDWSGLRPMTELEYEKAARGPVGPGLDEFAWGSGYHVRATAIVRRNWPDEHATGDATLQIHGTGTARTHFGPNHNNIGDASQNVNASWVTRNGAFANSGSSRISSGASYWGIMELGSNMAEKVVNVSTPQGRAFTGKHGDGRISTATSQVVTGAFQSHNVTGWPADNGIGHRGGNVHSGNLTLSNRKDAQNAWGHMIHTGGRGVRTIE